MPRCHERGAEPRQSRPSAAVRGEEPGRKKKSKRAAVARAARGDVKRERRGRQRKVTGSAREEGGALEGRGKLSRGQMEEGARGKREGPLERGSVGRGSLRRFEVTVGFVGSG